MLNQRQNGEVKNSGCRSGILLSRRGAGDKLDEEEADSGSTTFP
jgi:hypothetical protein